MTTTAAPRPTGARSTPPNRDYFELSERAKAAGLMGRRVGTYMVRTASLALAFLGATAAMFALGSSPWQLAIGGVFGILFTQAAFLAHDSAHQQVFASGRRNEWFSRIVGNLVVGLSLAWWTRKHNKHHAHPNTIGKDGDIAGGVLVFVPGDEKGRTGFMGWLAKRQGWAFIPMLSLFAFVLHFEAISSVVKNRKMKHRVAEGLLVAIRLIGFPALAVAAMGPLWALAFLGVQFAVFGIYMGGSFAPNHKGMALLPEDLEVDYLRRQVLTSRNITGGRPMDWAMGGLNLQVEHHLFPRMPSSNLRKVRPLVKEFCAEKNIPYTETDLVTSYGIIIRYLNRVGLGYADPMDCPIVSQLRTGAPVRAA
ncbi:fatty acid desaturase family protein [Brachybacterium sp. GCM10030267]|uniref:fatty acid desaturase family protein n=1 Tax=Brachybacterium sp. GCM10030267 TaxID=3273381 RepID=UPI00361B71E3